MGIALVDDTDSSLLRDRGPSWAIYIEPNCFPLSIYVTHQIRGSRSGPGWANATRVGHTGVSCPSERDGRGEHAEVADQSRYRRPPPWPCHIRARTRVRNGSLAVTQGHAQTWRPGFGPLPMPLEQT